MVTATVTGEWTLSPKLFADRETTLDEKIGQMLLFGFRGLSVHKDHPILQHIRQRHLGGVVLFDYDLARKSYVRNIESPPQVKTLVRALQAASPTPLLIAIDHEGGQITRLKEEYGFPPTVSAQFLGSKNDLALTRKYASAMAQTLSELGINLNLAPVVDLNINPHNPIIGTKERSFSVNPELVTKHALAFIEAHHEKDILCTLKHFPGHGSSTTDSHLGLVDVTNTWSPRELEPYTNIINAGRADVIMTAHVFNARLDPKFPATLSKPTITGILRKKLNYDGVVISDDMQMGAISKEYGFESAIRAAIEAGVDILAFANNVAFEEDIVARAFSLIKKLVMQGKISTERIDKSYQRIKKLKTKLLPP